MSGLVISDAADRLETAARAPALLVGAGRTDGRPRSWSFVSLVVRQFTTKDTKGHKEPRQVCNTRKIRTLWRDREGSALVEGAVLTPVLMSLLFGVYEFSFFFYQQQQISTGVREAARYLARTSDPTVATVQTCAKNIAIYGDVNSSCSGAATGVVARVNGWTTGAITVTVTDDANSGASTPCGASPCNVWLGDPSSDVQVIKVSTSFLDPSLGLFGFLGLTAPTINVSHTERAVGPG
jgi:Flp pilus assembly protein TadG